MVLSALLWLFIKRDTDWDRLRQIEAAPEAGVEVGADRLRQAETKRSDTIT